MDCLSSGHFNDRFHFIQRFMDFVVLNNMSEKFDYGREEFALALIDVQVEFLQCKKLEFSCTLLSSSHGY